MKDHREEIAVLILAAGRGERMKSERPKVLHRLGGKPLLNHVVSAAKALKPKRLVVLTGHKADLVREALKNEELEWATQRQQLGTAHAVLCGLEALNHFKGWLFILSGDVPLIRSQTLERMMDAMLSSSEGKSQASLALLTMKLEDPTGYGRILRDQAGHLLRIVEEKEATEKEKKISEINAGVYLARIEDLETPLRKVEKSIAKGEYYLTALPENLINGGKKVLALFHEESEELMGINSRAELARSERLFQQKLRQKWLDKGVTFLDPSTTYLESDVELSQDVILHPGVVISGHTKIGRGTEVLAYSVIEESLIGEEARIGPFAHLRPGTVLASKTHVGNFVELKKTRLGEGAKVNHLSYLGDAEVGSRVNVGAGTITCNYDGIEKHKTIIEDGVFIGSDTQLVAPVTVGKNAVVGAGTTVTKNIPSEALAISRVEQLNILNYKRKTKKS